MRDFKYLGGGGGAHPYSAGSGGGWRPGMDSGRGATPEAKTESPDPDYQIQDTGIDVTPTLLALICATVIVMVWNKLRK